MVGPAAGARPDDEPVLGGGEHGACVVVGLDGKMRLALIICPVRISAELAMGEVTRLTSAPATCDVTPRTWRTPEDVVHAGCNPPTCCRRTLDGQRSGHAERTTPGERTALRRAEPVRLELHQHGDRSSRKLGDVSMSSARGRHAHKVAAVGSADTTGSTAGEHREHHPALSTEELALGDGVMTAGG
jgi:hypothetical protein